VSLTFEGQEKDTRDDTNTHKKANDKQGDKIMCPVRAAAELMSNLYKSKLPKNKIPDLKLNSIIKQGKVSSITSTMVLDRIRRAV
jgi:C4-type Zn-finger protein